MRRYIIDCSEYLFRLLLAIKTHLSTEPKGHYKSVHWVKLLQKLKSELVYTENIETKFLSQCGVYRYIGMVWGKEVIREERTNMALGDNSRGSWVPWEESEDSSIMKRHRHSCKREREATAFVC